MRGAARPRTAGRRTRTRSRRPGSRRPRRSGEPRPARRRLRCAAAKCSCTVGRPRRTADPSITSSWTSANVCSSSIAAATSVTIGSSVSPPAPTNAQKQNAGRSRLPPAATSSRRAVSGASRSGASSRQRCSSSSSRSSMRCSTRPPISASPDGDSTGRVVRTSGSIAGDARGSAPRPVAASTGSVHRVQPFERLRYIARHAGDDRTIVAEAADCLAAFDDDPAGLVVACRRLIDHHTDSPLLWWLCARVLAAPDPSDAAWEAEGLVRDDHTPGRLAGLLPFPHDPPDRGDRVARARRRGARVAARPRRARGAGRRRRPLAAPPRPQRRDRPARRRGRGHRVRAVARAASRSSGRAPSEVLVPLGTGAVLEELVRPTTLVWLVAGVGRVLPARLYDAMRRSASTRSRTTASRPSTCRSPTASRAPPDSSGPERLIRRVDAPVAPELLRAVYGARGDRAGSGAELGAARRWFRPRRRRARVDVEHVAVSWRPTGGDAAHRRRHADPAADPPPHQRARRRQEQHDGEHVGEEPGDEEEHARGQRAARRRRSRPSGCGPRPSSSRIRRHAPAPWRFTIQAPRNDTIRRSDDRLPARRATDRPRSSPRARPPAGAGG